tara:strand:+ start:272 stop:796 length:525 start_codon:yes stop_codon:yes gene_type:complete
MKIVNNIIIQHVKEHKQIKEELLKRILKVEAGPYKTVSRTDWHIKGDINKDVSNTYFTDILVPVINKYYKNIREHYYKELMDEVKIIIDNYWFQTYLKNSSHVWHTHPRANFGNVYYVELPDSKFSTKFYGVEDLPVKEGDLITFPAFLAHSSPINLNERGKTIVSFNTNMEID